MSCHKPVACVLVVILLAGLSLSAAGGDPVPARDTLEDRVAALEAEIDGLRSQVAALEAHGADLEARLRTSRIQSIRHRLPPLPDAVEGEFNGITYYTMRLGRAVSSR